MQKEHVRHRSDLGRKPPRAVFNLLLLALLCVAAPFSIAQDTTPKAVRLVLPVGTFEGQELSLEHTVYYFNDRESAQVVSAKIGELVTESTSNVDSIEFMSIRADHALEGDVLKAVNGLAQQNSAARRWSQMARVDPSEIPEAVRDHFSALSNQAALFVGTVSQKTMEHISIAGTPIVNARRSYSPELSRTLTLSRFVMGGAAIHLTLVYGEGLPHLAVLPVTLAAAYSELKVFQYYSFLFPWYAHRPVLRRPVHGDEPSGFVGSLAKQWSVSMACWSFITAAWAAYGLTYDHFLRDWVGGSVDSVFPHGSLDWDFVLKWSFLSSLRSTFAMGGWRMVLSWWEADNIRLNPTRRGRYELVRDGALVGFGTLTLGLVVLSALEVEFSKMGIWILGSTGWASVLGFKVFRKQINRIKLWGLERFHQRQDRAATKSCEKAFDNSPHPESSRNDNNHVSMFFPRSVATATA